MAQESAASYGTVYRGPRSMAVSRSSSDGGYTVRSSVSLTDL